MSQRFKQCNCVVHGEFAFGINVPAPRQRRRPGKAQRAAVSTDLLCKWQKRRLQISRRTDVRTSHAIEQRRAASRTDFVTANSVAEPSNGSLASGPVGTRSRLGLSPTSPQQLAGTRIEPPPSLACASGTIPAATAAAEPPLEPPGLKPAFHGL